MREILSQPFPSFMRPHFHISIPVVSVLMALPVLTHGQAPTPPAETPAPATTVAPAPRRLLLKLGLTPSRLIPQYRYSGFNWVVAPSLGVEYQLGPHVSVYGQADVDFSFSHRDVYYFGVPEKEALVHSGALGIGLRYYYNQAGRERHNRAHGAFQGNYLALEALTELQRIRDLVFDDYTYPYPTQFTFTYRTQTTPLLNVYWGMQRRLGQHFLYDVNVGAGIIAKPTTFYYHAYYRNDRPLYYLDGDFAINLRLYVVR
jgi:hypothetical protein